MWVRVTKTCKTTNADENVMMQNLAAEGEALLALEAEEAVLA